RTDHGGVLAKNLGDRRFSGFIPPLESADEVPHEKRRRRLLAIDAFTYLSDRAGRICCPDSQQRRTNPTCGLHYRPKLCRGTNHEKTSHRPEKEPRLLS